MKLYQHRKQRLPLPPNQICSNSKWAQNCKPSTNNEINPNINFPQEKFFTHPRKLQCMIPKICKPDSRRKSHSKWVILPNQTEYCTKSLPLSKRFKITFNQVQHVKNFEIHHTCPYSNKKAEEKKWKSTTLLKLIRELKQRANLYPENYRDR